MNGRGSRQNGRRGLRYGAGSPLFSIASVSSVSRRGVGKGRRSGPNDRPALRYALGDTDRRGLRYGLLEAEEMEAQRGA